MFETIDNAVLVVKPESRIADACLVDRVITSVERAHASSRLAPATSDAPVIDRRTSARYDRCGLPAARLRAGQALTLLNLSEGGLQAVSDSRLLPGTAEEVTLRSDDDRRWTLRALVLRCRVSYLEEHRVRFVTALSFLEPCSWSPTASAVAARDSTPLAPIGRLCDEPDGPVRVASPPRQGKTSLVGEVVDEISRARPAQLRH